MIEARMAQAAQEWDAGRPPRFVVLRNGEVVGSTRFMRMNRQHRRVEIGSTFYGPISRMAARFSLIAFLATWAVVATDAHASDVASETRGESPALATMSPPVTEEHEAVSKSPFEPARAISPVGDHQPSFDPAARLLEAITATRLNAYRSDQVDWVGLEAALSALAAVAIDTADMLHVYARVVDALGDGHSFVQSAQSLREAYKLRHGLEFDHFFRRAEPTSTFIDRREPATRIARLSTGRAAAVVSVPKMFGGGDLAAAFANAVYDGIAQSAPVACGYIVDLRGNVGGNVWPMRLGLTELLGQAYDRADKHGRIHDGAAVIVSGEQAGAVIVKLNEWRPMPGLEHAPVAVLADDATGSSGEGVLVSFKGRANTRFFGQTSAGVASVNEGFRLSDGVNLVVTTSMMQDRNGVTYPDGVEPSWIR